MLGESLGAHELETLRREGGRDHGLRHQVEERVEIAGQALTGEDRGVQPHVEAGRGTEGIESVGPCDGVPARRAAEHRLRGQSCDARSAGRLEVLAGFHREQHGHRPQSGDRDGGHAQAVGLRPTGEVDHPASGMK